MSSNWNIYSDALKGVSGKKWTDGNLDKYLKSPADYAPGNAMAFAGIPSAKDRGDVIAYLKSQSWTPCWLIQKRIDLGEWN